MEIVDIRSAYMPLITSWEYHKLWQAWLAGWGESFVQVGIFEAYETSVQKEMQKIEERKQHHLEGQIRNYSDYELVIARFNEDLTWCDAAR